MNSEKTKDSQVVSFGKKLVVVWILLILISIVVSSSDLRNSLISSVRYITVPLWLLCTGILALTSIYVAYKKNRPGMVAIIIAILSVGLLFLSGGRYDKIKGLLLLFSMRPVNTTDFSPCRFQQSVPFVSIVVPGL